MTSPTRFEAWPHHRIPVSYTHLDVYKRQAQSLVAEGSWSRTNPGTIDVPNQV
ncbi:hypothetical protein [Burkholderia plantarii]|uniref:hypothetical protein n=1 Tax=Burkholderia plantarii TaxID=41899 RepID=UPI00149591E5|nr:hypothetical protein [Burkholderia plantarii]